MQCPRARSAEKKEEENRERERTMMMMKTCGESGMEGLKKSHFRGSASGFEIGIADFGLVCRRCVGSSYSLVGNLAK